MSYQHKTGVQIELCGLRKRLNIPPLGGVRGKTWKCILCSTTLIHRWCVNCNCVTPSSPLLEESWEDMQTTPIFEAYWKHKNMWKLTRMTPLSLSADWHSEYANVEFVNDWKCKITIFGIRVKKHFTVLCCGSLCRVSHRASIAVDFSFVHYR